MTNNIPTITIYPTEPKRDTKTMIWENLQFAVLIGTILGQVIVGGFYLWAQMLWAACNGTALIRNFILHRPVADKVKDAGMLALSVGLVILRIAGIY